MGTTHRGISREDRREHRTDLAYLAVMAPGGWGLRSVHSPLPSDEIYDDIALPFIGGFFLWLLLKYLRTYRYHENASPTVDEDGLTDPMPRATPWPVRLAQNRFGRLVAIAGIVALVFVLYGQVGTLSFGLGAVLSKLIGFPPKDRR